MKYFNLLPLAALGAALVVPNEQTLNEVSIESNHRQAFQEPTWTKEEVLESFKSHYKEVTETVEETAGQVSDRVKDTSAQAYNALDTAFASATNAGNELNDKVHESAYDAQSWFESALAKFEEHDDEPPHHKKPHHGPPKDGPPHHGPPHHGPPHHGGPHHKSNLTVYQLISESKYTTKLAKLINEFPDLVEALNGTKANYTVFAPTDKAFEKIPEHAPKPDKKTLEAILAYHVSPEFYPAGRVLVTHTIPTTLKGDHLGSEPHPQRLSVNLGLRGLTLNFYSRIIAIDIFGSNGVIHGVDSLLLPPPNVIKIIDLLPSEFSTLELGLGKTGLLETLNSTDHAGGTFFAPSNFAFAKLGPKINAFLFSTYGQKYLKALLQYHVVPDNTLYSDAYYEAKTDGLSIKDDEHHSPTKGYFHVDLPTMLEDRHLSVDVARYGGFISIKVNAFSRVTVQDGIAQDGVIQVVSDVLIPPKKLGGLKERVKSWKFWQAEGEDMTVEELKQRLEPFVESTYDL